VQGPQAQRVMERATGQPVPDIRFFHMDVLTIGGHPVTALRHGMVGQPGWELFGPWDHGDDVRRAILEAGRDLGIRQVGARTYPTSCLESGWIPSPLPAIYTGAPMQPYRQWLTDKSYEATASLGGSYYAEDIAAYYLTPWDLGYGSLVKFDHDFIGRPALERMSRDPRRTKVTLVWNADDVARVLRTLFSDAGQLAKFLDLPLANYATLPFDRVMKNGQLAGLSTYTGYTVNERAMVSLAILDNEHSAPGTEVTVVWGEENGGSAKPTVERHKQVEIRATVAPVPISEVARTAYRPG
jgi:vanillate/3-O-methylgallate O-demethylase